MKIIKIYVKNADIFAEVAKTTAYAGAKTDSGDPATTFDRVATVDPDENLLERYRQMACSELIDALRAFVTGADFSGPTLSLTLEVSGSYDDSLTRSVETDIFSFIVAAISARWFRVTWPAKAGEYGEEARGFITEATRKLYHRRRPMRIKQN